MNPFLFPEIVQIQTHSFCNADCIICPYEESSKQNKMGFMEEDLFKKIINECSKHSPRMINLFLMNEPLMDNRLTDFINYAKEKNPKTTIDISTNASILTKEKTHELINSGLDSISISFHSNIKQDYEKIMKKLNFEKTFANIKYFLEINNSSNKRLKVFISMKPIKGFSTNIDKFKEFCEKYDVLLHVGLITNRAGNVRNYKRFVENDCFVGNFCKRPFGYFGVLFNGVVVLCCADWNRIQIMGNMREQSILQIWNNFKYQDVRLKFNENRLNELSLCKNCRINSKLNKRVYI